MRGGIIHRCEEELYIAVRSCVARDLVRSKERSCELVQSATWSMRCARQPSMAASLSPSTSTSIQIQNRCHGSLDSTIHQACLRLPSSPNLSVDFSDNGGIGHSLQEALTTGLGFRYGCCRSTRHGAAEKQAVQIEDCLWDLQDSAG